MSGKDDIRGYINPFTPGETESGQRAAMPPGIELYVENREGKVIDKLILSVRRRTVIAVKELHCLAPSLGRTDKRRRLLAERVERIKARGGSIFEPATGYRSGRGKLAIMLLTAYHHLATRGRARKRDQEGRPPIWPTSGPIYDGMELIWQSRRHHNDDERITAIVKRYGKSPSRVWLRLHMGPPRGKQARDKG